MGKITVRSEEKGLLVPHTEVTIAEHKGFCDVDYVRASGQDFQEALERAEEKFIAEKLSK